MNHREESATDESEEENKNTTDATPHDPTFDLGDEIEAIDGEIEVTEESIIATVEPEADPQYEESSDIFRDAKQHQENYDMQRKIDNLTRQLNDANMLIESYKRETGRLQAALREIKPITGNDAMTIIFGVAPAISFIPVGVRIRRDAIARGWKRIKYQVEEVKD